MSNNSITEKRCANCKKQKHVSQFGKNTIYKDNLHSECKLCSKIRASNYRKTEKGVLTTIYANQINNSKVRGHDKPAYTKRELTDWIYSNGFYAMYCQWIWSGYSKELTPSCDRLDDYKSYILTNLRLVTTKKNREKAYKQRQNAESTTGIVCKKVKQYTKDGYFVREYKSMSIAAREFSINVSHICACTKGRRKSAGGFIWQV